MIRRILQFRQLFSFSKTKQSFSKGQQSISIVSSIIEHQSRDPSFIYRQTNRVCNLIASLFEGIPQKQEDNIQQLKKLMKNVHLSSFSSWKYLNQTSLSIRRTLNQSIPETTKLLNINSLIQTLDILDTLNYELQGKQDSKFISSQFQSKTNFQDLLTHHSSQSLRILQAYSKHSSILGFFSNKKSYFQQFILELIDKAKHNSSRFDEVMIANIVKNGLFRKFWSESFLSSIRTIFQSRNNLSLEFQSLLNTIRLDHKFIDSSQLDKWTSQPLKKSYYSSNFVTQSKIHNILKELDYNVLTNQHLFGFQIDFKLGQNSIVQYHGLHHYRINSETPLQTQRSSWKVSALKQRGYKVCVIPFYEWNKLQTIYEKKSWLISHIEDQLFFH